MSPRQTLIDGNKKECKHCKQVKLLEEFVNDPRTTTGKTARCKECVYTSNSTRYHTNEVFKEHNKSLSRKSALKCKYGLSQQDFQDMVDNQNNKCLICQVDFSQKQFHIDHDHKTNKVRGLLCVNCNVGLGNFMDNPDYLNSAILYLRDNS